MNQKLKIVTALMIVAIIGGSIFYFLQDNQPDTSGQYPSKIEQTLEFKDEKNGRESRFESLEYWEP